MSGHRCILCYRLCILPKLCHNVCLFEVTIVNIQIVGRAVLVHLLIQQSLCLQQHFFHFDWSIYLQQKYCRTIGVGKEFCLRELKVLVQNCLPIYKMLVAFLGSMLPIFSHQSGDILVLQNKKISTKLWRFFLLKLLKMQHVSPFFAQNSAMLLHI